MAQSFKLNRNTGQTASDNTIINLSDSYILNQDQISLLQKRLSFVPYSNTVNQDRLETQFQLTQYHRRLKLLAYFNDNDKETRIPFLPKSKWEPKSKNLPMEVGEIMKKDWETLKTYDFNTPTDQPNLTKGEEEALKTLMSDSSIIIKPADKGNAIIIMNRNQYLKEVHN